MSFAVLLPSLVSILGQAPGVIEDVKKIWDLVKSDKAPTEEEQKAFDAALEEAHKSVQDM